MSISSLSDQHLPRGLPSAIFSHLQPPPQKEPPEPRRNPASPRVCRERSSTVVVDRSRFPSSTILPWVFGAKAVDTPLANGRKHLPPKGWISTGGRWPYWGRAFCDHECSMSTRKQLGGAVDRWPSQDPLSISMLDS